MSIKNNTSSLQSLLEAVNNLPNASSSGPNTSDATALPSDILSGKTAYVAGQKITGTIATVTQATPSISVSSGGLITASATQSTGYVTGGSKSGTKQLSTQSAKTVTPTTSNQTAVSSGIYTTGAITVKGDSNLIASNIKSGVSIFGVTGTYEGSGGSTSNVETCTISVINAENLTILGTIVNDSGEFTDYYGNSSDEDLENFKFLKNSIIVFFDEEWSIIPTGSFTVAGALNMGHYMQQGAVVFQLNSDRATFEFVSF